MDFDLASIREVVITFGLVLGSLVLHECGHAFMADRLGDHTPRSQGRCSLDPLVHIDLVGTVLVPILAALGLFGGLAVIGWAKPVEITPSNLYPGYKKRALVTIAGPAVNLVLAFLSVAALAVVGRFSPQLSELFMTALVVNVGLFVFNLLPVAPLDGSKFLMYFGAMSEEVYERFAAFGWIILLVLINLPPFRLFFGALVRGGVDLLLLPIR